MSVTEPEPRCEQEFTTEEGKAERTAMEMMSNFCSFVQASVTKLNKRKIVSVQQNHLTRTVFR